MARYPYRALLLALLSALLVAAGCGPSSPEAKVAKIRSQYKVELNSWRALAPEAVAEEVAEGMEAEEASPDAETAAGEMTEGETTEGETAEGETAEGETAEGGGEMAAAPATQNVLFDVVIYFRGDKALEGITVDITQAGADQTEKAVFRQWLDTKGIVNGETRQADFILEGLTVAEGDVFAVGVLAGIPTDLSAYREFSQPAP